MVEDSCLVRRWGRYTYLIPAVTWPPRRRVIGSDIFRTSDVSLRPTMNSSLKNGHQLIRRRQGEDGERGGVCEAQFAVLLIGFEGP